MANCFRLLSPAELNPRRYYWTTTTDIPSVMLFTMRVFVMFFPPLGIVSRAMVFQFPLSVGITKTWFSDFLSSMVHGYRFPLLVGCILVFPSHTPLEKTGQSKKNCTEMP